MPQNSWTSALVFLAVGLTAACSTEGDTLDTGREQGRRFERVLPLEDSAYTSGNVSVGDVNGDGRLDVLLVKGRHWPLQNLVRLGDGQGRFSPPRPVGPGPDRSYTGALVDLDDDGDLDLVVSNDSPDPKRVLHNDGTGAFREVQEFGSPDWNTRHVSVADLDGDGRPDVVVANRGGRAGTDSFVCFGAPAGRLEEPCTPVYRGSATTITPVDVDGDGDLDLVIPHRDGGQSEIRLNDGTGAFPERRAFGPEEVGYRSAAVADFDGDGRVDIAVIAPGSRTGVGTPGPDGGSGVVAPALTGIFYGREDGDFSELVPLTEGQNRPYAILAEDVDRDGRTDLLIGHVEAPSVVLFNEGERRFSVVPFGDGAGAAYGFAVADLDEDGVLDIVLARSDAVNVVYFGGGDRSHLEQIGGGS
jgi:hypothetical protein